MNKSLILAIIITVVLVVAVFSVVLIKRNKDKKKENKDVVFIPDSFQLPSFGDSVPKTIYKKENGKYYRETTGGIAGFMKVEITKERYEDSYKEFLNI